MEFEGTTIEELNEYLMSGMPDDGEWYKSDTGDELVGVSNQLDKFDVPLDVILSTIESIVSTISNEYGG